jgi:hypothetical protein
VNPAQQPAALYDAMARYLIAAGWRREELGSGWWWREDQDESRIGEAVETQLRADGVDTRTAVAGEPQEFWG